MKRMIAIIVSVCLLISMSVPAFAAEIQPRSTLNYGSFTLSAGGTRYLMNNDGNFIIRSGKTATISYTTSSSGSIKVYFHNSTTGTNTRVYSSYTPSSTVTGYFYIYNSSGSSVYLSNVSIQY